MASRVLGPSAAPEPARPAAADVRSRGIDGGWGGRRRRDFFSLGPSRLLLIQMSRRGASRCRAPRWSPDRPPLGRVVVRLLGVSLPRPRSVTSWEVGRSVSRNPPAHLAGVRSRRWGPRWAWLLIPFSPARPRGPSREKSYPIHHVCPEKSAAAVSPLDFGPKQILQHAGLDRRHLY